MHHGYYEPGKKVSNQQAQVDMIERSLEWAGVTAVRNVSAKLLHLLSARHTSGYRRPTYQSWTDSSDSTPDIPLRDRL